MDIWAWANPSAYHTPEQRERTLEFCVNAGISHVHIYRPGSYKTTPEEFAALATALNDHGISTGVWIWCMKFIEGGGVFDAGKRKAWAKEQAQWLTQLPVSHFHADGIRFDIWTYRDDPGIPQIDSKATAAVTALAQDLRDATAGVPFSVAARMISGNGHLSFGPYHNGDVQWPKDAPYFYQSQQRPNEWLEAGIVDYLCVMDYVTDPAHHRFEAQQWKRILPGHFDCIYHGLPWCAKDPPGSYTDTPQGINTKLQALRAMGATGAIVFQVTQHNYTLSQERALEAVLAKCTHREEPGMGAVQYLAGKLVELQAAVDELQASAGSASDIIADCQVLLEELRQADEAAQQLAEVL